MEIGTPVEYETGVAPSGCGVVIAFDEEADIVTVQDHDDGSVWKVPTDRATPLDE